MSTAAEASEVSQLKEPDDSELLRRAAAGDGRAFGSLVDRHSQRLFRIASSLVGSVADAEDVLQETFVGAYRGLRSFEGRASVKTWLTRILVIQAAKWRRENRKRLARRSEEMGEVPAAGSGELATAATLDLHAALQQLSVDHREVLVLREFEQLSYEEMADVLGVPRGTVESRLYRARAELREKLKSYL
jgi:RNA polymerase sigma-70 factor (ECF subfamily)